MLTVASVLRSGGRYGVDDVRKLYGMVRRNLSHFDRFVCLSDVEFEIEGVERIPLIDRFPGYWAKIELFRPSVFYGDARVWFADLDTVIVGNVDELAARTEDFIGLRDFYFPDRLASGLMLWSPTYRGGIYTDFIVNAKQIIAQYRRGDQEFIEPYVSKPAYWQDVLPGAVVSYKVHCKDGVPRGTKVVAFHGVPSPAQVADKWVKEHWAA